MRTFEQPKSRWVEGDPEPPSTAKLRDPTGEIWYSYLGGWRNGDMAPYATIEWPRLVAARGPLREIRVHGGKWYYADEIPPPSLTDLDTDAARAAGWVRLDEVLAALRELDPVEAALAGQGAFLLAADLLAEQFGAVTDVSSTDVRMTAHRDTTAKAAQPDDVDQLLGEQLASDPEFRAAWQRRGHEIPPEALRDHAATAPRDPEGRWT